MPIAEREYAPPIKLENCFGYDLRDSGQRRVPDPPAKSTGDILLIDYFSPTIFIVGSSSLCNALVAGKKRVPKLATEKTALLVFPFTNISQIRFFTASEKSRPPTHNTAISEAIAPLGRIPSRKASNPLANKGT